MEGKRKVIERGPLWAAAVLATVSAGGLGGMETPPDTVVVGPEIAMDGSRRPLVEFAAAASPVDPRRLLSAAFDPVGSRSVLHLSEDGGWSWSRIELLEQTRAGGADPVVAFLPSGAAVFVALSPVEGGVGRPQNRLHVFHSDDGGRHWSAPLVLDDHGYDRPVVASRPGPGGPGGDLHLLVRIPARGRLALLTSHDGGRTFDPATTVAESSTDPLLTFGLAVLPSGDIVVPHLAIDPEGEARIDVVRSVDGGATFSDPVTVATPTRRDGAPDERAERGVGALSGSPAVVASPSDGAVHLAWRSDTPTGSRIFLSRSTDGGRTWSEPVTPGAGGGGEGFQPILGVSPEGTLGVGWLEATVDGDGVWRQDTWFAASTDGGASFGSPARLTSQGSAPRAPGNRSPSATVLRLRPTETGLFVRSPFSRFPTGGDYMAMAVTSDGVFHPVWPDSRRGRYQPWTTRVTVGPPAVDTTGLEAPRPLADVRVVVEEAVAAGPDSVRLHLRLRNAGTDTVWPPLRLHEGVADDERGARVRQRGSGPAAAAPARTLDFSEALGDLGFLPPSGVTGASSLTVGLDEAGGGLLRLEVRGRLRSAGGSGG